MKGIEKNQKEPIRINKNRKEKKQKDPIRKEKKRYEKDKTRKLKLEIS